MIKVAIVIFGYFGAFVKVMIPSMTKAQPQPLNQ